MSVSISKPVHTVSVRELVQFVLREGDLGGERQFVGSDRALAGIRGHQKIQRSRPAAYQTEIPVELMVEAQDFTLHVRGRIDGVLVTAQEVLLEEIKTVQGWDKQADPLHWAQAKFYGYIYACDHALAKIVIQLTYLELTTDQVTEFRKTFTRDELAVFFTETTAIYSDWVRQQYRWVRERNDVIRSLAFPFPKYRQGQRELAVSAYRVLSEGGRLFLGAPTGIGKTVSVRRKIGTPLLPHSPNHRARRGREIARRSASGRIKTSRRNVDGETKSVCSRWPALRSIDLSVRHRLFRPG